MSHDSRKRALFAFALVLAVGSAMSESAAMDRLPYPRGLATVLPLAFLGTPTGQGLAAVVVLALLGLFVSGRRVQLAGWGVFVIVMLLHAVTRSVHPDETDRTQGAQLPCASLAAWLIGTAIAPRLKRDGEALGQALASGVVAAGYTMAAISKLRLSGLGWIDGRMLALLIWERGESAGFPFEAVRHAVGSSPALCTLGMTTVLVLEASGALFLFRRARRPYAAAMIGFHLTAGLLLGYPHLDWAVTALSWAWVAGGPATPPAVDGAAPARAAAPPT